MALNDTLANILSHMLNCEKKGREDCVVRSLSKVSLSILEILKSKGYIKEIEVIETTKDNLAKITLAGMINKCGVIKPRFSVKLKDYEKFEKRFLPAKDFGVIIVSTNKGIMTHIEAKDKKLGGKLLAYCY